MSIKHADYQLKITQTHRAVKYRRYFPEESGPTKAWVLFSVGYGGNVEGYAYLAREWVSQGLAVVVVEHSGSNLDVLKALPQKNRQARNEEVVRRVKDPVELLARAEDFEYVYGSLKAEIADAPILLAGHSYGSYTVLASLGLRSHYLAKSFEPIPARAVLLMSPQPPGMLFEESEYKRVNCPCFVMTGTKDDLLAGGQDFHERVKVFTHLQPQYRLLLVFEAVAHMTFAGLGLGVKEQLHQVLRATQRWWELSLSSDSLSGSWQESLGAVLDTECVHLIDGPSQK